MKWRDHLRSDVDMIADGLTGLARTVCAMLLGEREGPTSVRWRTWRFRVDARRRP